MKFKKISETAMVIEHDGYDFQVNPINVIKGNEMYGGYIDRLGFHQNIHRDSIYGEHVRRAIVDTLIKISTVLT
jgi:hypothetical protein